LPPVKEIDVYADITAAAEKIKETVDAFWK